MGSGVNRVVVGSVTGTGSIINVSHVGFRPKRVTLDNVGGLVTASWHKDMADASAIIRVTAGDMTFVTSDGVTPLAGGFRIGADANINASGELIHWTAYE